jgi:predicted nucleic acid-binding protein
MLLIDTSVWIGVFRDRTGQVRQHLETLIAERQVFITRFTQLELLQGSLNEQEWTILSTYLETQVRSQSSVGWVERSGTQHMISRKQKLFK